MGRVLIAILCLATAGGLGYAAFSERWLENTKTGLSFSLLSSKRCTAASCESKSNSEVMIEIAMEKHEEPSRAFSTAGKATLGFSLFAALTLVLCAGYLVAGKRTSGPNGPQHVALLGLTLSLITATVFVKTKPGGPAGVGAGQGFYIFIVACVVGIIAAQLASKQIKPLESDTSL